MSSQEWKEVIWKNELFRFCLPYLNFHYNAMGSLHVLGTLLPVKSNAAVLKSL